jgi:hypothetical protein
MGPSNGGRKITAGFGFNDEQYQVLEAVTWGVSPKEIRLYYKKNAKCGLSSKKDRISQ